VAWDAGLGLVLVLVFGARTPLDAGGTVCSNDPRDVALSSSPPKTVGIVVVVVVVVGVVVEVVVALVVPTSASNRDLARKIFLQQGQPE
jgi:hypothetical protein